ncbi:armadillo-type protein [Achaetomium macrosporum]|uniref:Armadillo-type protein n=1 Tax=Achaetomium macrosporum TaxID=79813 RepID=A0AAN7CJ44_9PEZI|nr:armadillo-type protein [Achaetomium macrosporum]
MSSMAGLNTVHGFPASATTPRTADTEPRHHQRSKSSVLRSLMGGGHKRNNSDGSGLPSAPLLTPIATTRAFHISQQSLAPSRSSGVFHVGFDAAAAAAMEPERYAYALGELQQNRQERSPERPRGRDRGDQAPPSPTKSGLGTTLRAFGERDRDSSKPPKTRENGSVSPVKPKKAKSATNLVSLLRPKSIKNLKQLLTDEGDAARDAAKEKDKENRSPPNSVGGEGHANMPPPPPPPIYAQFASQHLGPPSPRIESPLATPIRTENPWMERTDGSASSRTQKPRPKSFQAYVTRRDDETPRSSGSGGSNSRAKRLTWGKSNTPSIDASQASGSKSSTPAARAAPEMPFIDPKDIDKHLEAMLDRRNIPENQRYKMRNLSDTIKMELIRQDWAEMQAKLERPPSHDGNATTGGSGLAPGVGASDQQGNNDNTGSPTKKDKKKHGRGLSLTIVRSGNKSNPSSPSKKKGDSSLGRHFRTKSSESLVSEPPSPGLLSSSYGNSLLAKVKGQQLPGDFVAYLQKVQQPELVEVGKLHKLRLLLRNETVAWTEEFIRQGGMKEIVELLHRIMAVEWREEHEDALLHENLLCLKALCTTGMALQYLHSIHTTLFPALLHMIFDPEKKGPSEFTTRNIITSILFTYIEAATPQERVPRARAVLGYLRDPEPKEEDRPVDFVLEMRRERPYRVWCKEVVNVTKEVFWIFLHNLNIVALPSADNKSCSPDQPGSDSAGTSTTAPSNPSQSNITDTSSPDNRDTEDQYAYMSRHFPQERPPVPAAPYVGGVEWDATNYLASHLDLMNAILACTGPTTAERNALRAELRISGWERCLGGSLRLCKEKFYGAVHDGLRTWVAAAHEDGWDVRDVRYGPPPENKAGGGAKSRSASPAKKAPGANNNKDKNRDAPPRIEMPKLDLGLPPVGAAVGAAAAGGGGGDLMLSGVTRANEPWLS